jgi:hypothetical protein
MVVGAVLLALGAEFLAWGWIMLLNQLNYGHPAYLIAETIWGVGLILSPIGSAILAY